VSGETVRAGAGARFRRGFTLIELIVVMAVIATLLALVAPRYFSNIDRAKETVLKSNLAQMRDAIGRYNADKGRYPADLEALVKERYLRDLPVDPVAESTQKWVLVPPEDPKLGGVFDVRSGAEGEASDGTPYASW
jgi:general secretion pathway protein G